jgi:hypothetical protein
MGHLANNKNRDIGNTRKVMGNMSLAIKTKNLLHG